MENKKNAVLLTVIAVATLLVAVVGATFAYFSAQGTNSDAKQVTVTTHTTDTATVNIAGNLEINATQDTFGQGKGNLLADTKGTVYFKANDADEADFCYTVDLKITNNTFKLCADDTTCNTNAAVTTKNTPELTFTAKKGNTEASTTAITGFDAKDVTKQTTSINIPGELANGVHKIHAAKGAAVTDYWDFNLTLVNQDWDQQYNVGAGFTGTIEIAKVDCPAA